MNFEDALNFLGKYRKTDKIKLLNPKKMQDIAETHQLLRSMIDNQDPEVSIEIREGALELGDVYIRIITPQFTSYNTASLAKAIQKADHIDIYPTADNRIKIDIMFNKAYYVQTLES